MKINEFLGNKKLTRRILFFITFALVLAFTLFYWQGLIAGCARALQVISPFLTGIAVAFVLNVLVKLFENHIFSFMNKKPHRVWDKFRRPLCVLLAFLIVFFLLAGVIFYVLPELNRSIEVLTNNIPGYLKSFGDWATEQLKRLDVTQEQLDAVNIDWSSLLNQAGQVTGSVVGSLANAAMGLANGLVSFVMSIIFSVYMLLGKEKLLRNVRRAVFAFLPKPRAEKLISVGVLSNRIFSRFVTGQLTESLILGTLCYIGMSIFRFDYALLISVVICITSLVPVLGAYIGGGVGAFILLLIDPAKALWFLLFLVILQQFEGNVIYPRVVGSSIGLPGIWVLLAILVCGDLFGIPGILLGVPAFSVIYSLLRSGTHARLEKKRISDAEIAAAGAVQEDTPLLPAEESEIICEKQETPRERQ